MAQFVNFKTLKTDAETKAYGYLAFQFQCTAESVKGVLELGDSLLGDDDKSKLWELYNGLRESALALEPTFDAYCVVETGKRRGGAGGFAHVESTADAVVDYLEHREAHEED